MNILPHQYPTIDPDWKSIWCNSHPLTIRWGCYSLKQQWPDLIIAHSGRCSGHSVLFISRVTRCLKHKFLYSGHSVSCLSKGNSRRSRNCTTTRSRPPPTLSRGRRYSFPVEETSQHKEWWLNSVECSILKSISPCLMCPPVARIVQLKSAGRFGRCVIQAGVEISTVHDLSSEWPVLAPNLT